MELHNLNPAVGSVRTNYRRGRGQGSGGGGTATRGHKGAKSRSGYSSKRGFEGGQMPLQRRLPKFGFKNINRIEYKVINLDSIQELVEKLAVNKIDLALLISNGLASSNNLVKVLNRGELKSSVEIHAHRFSSTALKSIESVGGKGILISA